MVVLLLTVELEIVNELTGPDRDKLMLEASQAHRDRGRCLAALGRSESAQRDVKRAEQLEQDARKLTEQAENGQIELINRWAEPITLLIDGVSYRLAVGEKKLLPKRPGAFRYELPATGQISTGQIEAGKTFRLQVR